MKRAIVVVLALTACAAPAVRHGGIAVVIGDSVAHGAGDETGRGIAGRLPAANLGINGARTSDVLRLLKTPSAASLVATANVVIVSIGGNDLYGDPLARITTLLAPGLAIHRVAARVKMVVRDIERLNPSAHVILLGLYNPYGRAPFLDRAVNEWDAHLIETFAADRAVFVERIAAIVPGRLSSIDHFHPSAAGYAAIAARISVIAETRRWSGR